MDVVFWGGGGAACGGCLLLAFEGLLHLAVLEGSLLLLLL